MTTRPRLDPVLIEVLWSRVLSVVNEQQVALQRTAFSTIVRETQDLACGVFDTNGWMMAQSITGTPGHINAMATGVRHFLKEYPPGTLRPGDVLITNDPWMTAGQINDITVLTPVFKKGVECGRNASDPYFFPLYEEANRLDIPLCMHFATGNPPAPSDSGQMSGRFNAISAFTDLAQSRVPDRFPDLRVGWIETGASWIPFLMADLEAKKQKRTFQSFDLKGDLFRHCRFYVACDSSDDLPYILRYGTEDSLMIGTDYTHADQSQERNLQGALQARVDAGELSQGAVDKILYDNPKRLYGL